MFFYVSKMFSSNSADADSFETSDLVRKGNKLRLVHH